jgi:hypothetical protein
MYQVSIKRQINKELDILPVNLQKAPTGRFIVGRRPFFSLETREVCHVKRRYIVVFLSTTTPVN